MRYLTIILGTIAGLLLSLYGLLPWLVAIVVPALVIGQAGIEQFEVEMAYPGLNSVAIERLRLETGSQSLDLQDLTLSYSSESLRALRVDRAEVAEVTISWTEGVTEQADVRPDPAAEFTGPSIAEMFAQIPVERVRVDVLTVAVPELDFLASGRLALEDQQLDLTLNGQTPDIARDIRLRARINADGQIQVSFQDPDTELPSTLNVDAAVQTDRLAVEVELQLAGYGLKLVQEILAGYLAPGQRFLFSEGQLSATMKSTLPWPLESWPDWRTLNGSGTFAIDGSFAELGATLRGVEGVVDVHQGELGLELSADVQIENKDALTLTAHVVDGRFRFSGNTLSSDQPATVLQVHSPEIEARYQLQNLNLTVDEQPMFSSVGSLVLTTSTVVLDGALETRARSITSNYAGNLSFQGSARIEQNSVADYPLMLSSDYTIDDQQVGASILLSSGSLQSVPLQFNHDLGAGRGSLSISHRQTILEPLFASLIPDWSAPFELDSGVLAVDGELGWGESISARGVVTADSIGASFEDYRATDLTGDLDVALVNEQWTLRPSNLSVGLIDIGFPVSALTMELAGDLEEIRFRDVQAQALGGTVRVEGFDYNIDNGRAELVLQLHELQLTELLALEGDDVIGSGRLSGTIPISVTQNVARINGGQMSATEPGRIRLSPELAASITQPGLDIALQALENFTYERLETRIDYDDNGDMSLGIQIEGRNPDLEQGRPVHFNLNISENVPVLLRSLRLQDTFVKQIEKTVQ